MVSVAFLVFTLIVGALFWFLSNQSGHGHSHGGKACHGHGGAAKKTSNDTGRETPASTNTQTISTTTTNKKPTQSKTQAVKGSPTVGTSANATDAPDLRIATKNKHGDETASLTSDKPFTLPKVHTQDKENFADIMARRRRMSDSSPVNSPASTASSPKGAPLTEEESAELD